ncbi:hypothetical protein [Sorangium sp. So ce854]|uniref:hypothetical protein n=1 Tax=Sorangium sp. So ce854 TaxID=3133322 RepID=UPI003F603B5D
MTDEGEGSVNASPGLAARLCALALLTASGGLLASACADNESSLFVRQRMARTGSGGDCSVSCSPTEPFWSEDAIDSAYVSSHSATLLVGNQIVQRGDPDVLRTETSRIQLYEAEVRVFDTQGNPVNEGYVVPIHGIVDPGTGSNAGYNCTEVLLLDGATMDTLRGQAIELGRDVEVLATVLVRGRTLGGQEVEAAEWSYPVRVCFGCSPCADTEPTACCYGRPHPDCEDLEDVELSCSGLRSPVDCRSLGQTCAEHLAAARR